MERLPSEEKKSVILLDVDLITKDLKNDYCLRLRTVRSERLFLPKAPIEYLSSPLSQIKELSTMWESDTRR